MPELFAAIACAALALGLLVRELVLWWRARRADRQLEDERRMRAGFKTAKRMGWFDRDRDHD